MLKIYVVISLEPTPDCAGYRIITADALIPALLVGNCFQLFRTAKCTSILLSFGLNSLLTHMCEPKQLPLQKESLFFKLASPDNVALNTFPPIKSLIEIAPPHSGIGEEKKKRKERKDTFHY